MGIYAGHENYVGAVVSAKLQDGSEVVVTGSNDSTIMVTVDPLRSHPSQR